MIAPLTDEEEAKLAEFDLSPPQPDSSLLRRAGQQLANVPSDIFTDLSRLAFNVGIKSSDASNPPEAPQIFDIPKPTTLGESAVDIGATLVRALPLILSGEGATEGAAELAGAAPTLARILGSAGGFGLSGLTESKEQGAEQAALGAAFRGADFLPLKYKIPLATAIGLATGGEAYAHDPSLEKSVGIGVVNAALPFFLKGATEDALNKTRAEVPAPGTPMPAHTFGEFGVPLSGDRVNPTIPHSPLIEIPETVQPQANLLPDTAGRKVAPVRPTVTYQPDLPDLYAKTVHQPFLRLGAPEGSLVEEPTHFRLEAERGGLPPRGALTAEPTLTPEEVARGQRPPPPMFRLTSEPELDFPAPNGVNGIPPAPPVNDPLQRLLNPPPEGSLIRNAALTPGEIERALAARKARTAPPLLAPATEVPPIKTESGKFTQTPPEGFSAHEPQIQGPHVISTAYEDNGIHRVGPEFNTPHEGIGAYHENFEGVPEQSRGFIVQDFDGTQRFTRDRAEAQRIARQAGQTLTPDAAELQSQELRRVTQPLGDSTPIRLDAEHGRQLAEQFGLDYNGIQKGYKEAPGYLQFRDPKASGTAVAAIESRSVAEFKEHLKETRAKFDKEPVATLQSSTTQTPFRPAVTFRGQTFEGATHEDAIKKLEARFPDYRSTDRKADPIVRGYLNTKNQFEPNLLKIVRAAEAEEPKPILTHEIEVEHTPGTFASMQKLGSDADRVAALDAVKAGTKPVTLISGTPGTFVKEAKDRGLKIARFKNNQGTMVTVAHNNNPAAVKAIKEAYLSKLPNDERDVLMGKALGFRQDEIDDYLARRASHKVEIAGTLLVKGKELPRTLELLGTLDKLEGKEPQIYDVKLGGKTFQVKPEPPVATLQTKVSGNTVKIGDSSYQLKKVGLVWTYEGQPLARTKQAAVREIRKLHAAATSPSPSLENAQEKLALAGDGQRQSGDKVFVDFDGTPEPGTIVTPNMESGIHQVRLGDGSIVDIRDSKITAVPNAGKFEATRAGEVKQIGALEDFRKLEKDNAAKASGLKMRRPPGGESGAIPLEVAVAMSRYVVAPIVGAAIGAVMSDQDHRLAGAIQGAIALGAVGVFGPRLFRLLAEGHTDINDPASFPAAVKRTVTAARVATLQPAEATLRASVTASASNADRVALWMSRHLSTNLAATRLIMKARGEIEILGGALHKAIPVLAAAHKEGLPSEASKLIGDYFEGKISHQDFTFRLKNDELAQAAVVARQAATALQNVIAKGVTDPRMKMAVMESFDKYLTTSYRLFHDPKYFPSEEQIAKVAAELKDDGSSLETRIRIVTQDLKKLKGNRAIYRGGRSGESLAGVLFHKKDLSAVYQDALGIYTDPIEKIIATTNKLIPVARSAAFFNEVANATREDGLKYAFSREERDAILDNLRSRSAAAAVARDDVQVATLQQQIETVRSYVWNPENEAHGRLSNQFIDRRMHDALAQRDALIQESNSFIGRHLRNATTLFKYNKTVLSPIQFTRQIMNVPLLGAMSRTGPRDWVNALQSLRDPATRERLVRLGVASGDIVSGLLNHDLNALLKGNLDKFSFSNPIVSNLHRWQEIWRTPDLVVRVAAFQRQEAKALAAIPEGLSETERAIAVQKAQDAAIDFTNRYTMNYEVIPPGVRILSNVPFVNQFLTWAFELTRITKNVAQDAIQKKDPYAIATLAGLAGAPFALQKASEAMLSDKDQKDWEKAKALLPDYARGNFVWVTHRDEKGHFHYINFTGLVIHDSYLKMFRDVLHGDTKAFKADNPIFGWENTPLLNIATNQVSGEDIHTGQKLRTIGDRLDSARRDFAPTILGTDFDKFVKAVTPNAEGGWGITDVRTGQSTTLGGLLMSYVLAVRGYTTDLTALQRKAISAAQADINDQRAELNRLLRTNVRADVKQRAIDQFRFVQSQILQELAKQVRPDQ